MAVGSKWWMSSMSDDKISFDEGGFSFNVGGLSSGKIAVIFAAVSTIVGGLWAGFEVYQQFLTMKEVTWRHVSSLGHYSARKASISET